MEIKQKALNVLQERGAYCLRICFRAFFSLSWVKVFKYNLTFPIIYETESNTKFFVAPTSDKSCWYRAKRISQTKHDNMSDYPLLTSDGHLLSAVSYFSALNIVNQKFFSGKHSISRKCVEFVIVSQKNWVKSGAVTSFLN